MPDKSTLLTAQTTFPPFPLHPCCVCVCLTQAAGLLLCEVFLVGSAAGGADVMDIASLKRLLFDVFHEDVSLFKEYCLQVGGGVGRGTRSTPAADVPGDCVGSGGGVCCC